MKVLVVCDVHERFYEAMHGYGFSVVHLPDADDEEIKQMLPGFVGLIVSTKTLVNKEMIDQGQNLKFIGRVGSGMENIDWRYATEKGIECHNAPEGNRDAVAEHAIAMLLALFNKITIADAEVREGIWEREGNRGIELGGKTVGIIGYGNTGQAFAKRLAGFGVKVLAFDKYLEGFGNDRVQEASIEEIQEECDIISLHVPLTHETAYLINRDFIFACSKPFHLINTARGKVVHTCDLVEALRSGKVLGACLDVLEDEQITPESKKNLSWFSELNNFNNVILTPHVAGWTVESRQKLADVLVQKIMSNPLKS